MKKLVPTAAPHMDISLGVSHIEYLLRLLSAFSTNEFFKQSRSIDNLSDWHLNFIGLLARQ